MTKRVVLVTGGGIGIGRATALAFADKDCHVVVTDVLEAEGNAVADEIRGKGGSADFRHLDVTDTAQANAVVADTEKRLGMLDVVVANARIAHRVPFGAMTDEKWDHTFDVDLKGILRIVRSAVPGMVKRGYPGAQRSALAGGVIGVGDNPQRQPCQGVRHLGLRAANHNQQRVQPCR